MTKALLNLVGKKVNSDLKESELESIAKEAGYDKYQVREPGYMYDCQFDESRLQVHVDKDKTITSVRKG
jgi:hypothetical protein